jgi:hypothetical protein
MAGSSLNVRIRRIEITQSAMATTVQNMLLQVVRLTSAGSGGTAATISALDTSDAVPGATAQILPSSKGTENTIVYYGPIYMMQTLAVSNPVPTPGLIIDFDRPRMKPLIIAAGTSNGIAIKNVGGGCAGSSVVINVWFSETSF